MKSSLIFIFGLPTLIFVLSFVGIIGALVSSPQFDVFFDLLAATPVAYGLYYYVKHKQTVFSEQRNTEK